GTQCRFLAFGEGGSGRVRIAVTMFIRLTRQAENVTTRNVSRTARGEPTVRLRAVTAYSISKPAPSVSNAAARTNTMPNATTAPTSAPTAAAARSYPTPSNRNTWTRGP